MKMFRSRFGHSLIDGMRAVLAGAGLFAVPTVGVTMTYEAALEINTVQAYTQVILANADEVEVESALCRLRELDADASASVAAQYSELTQKQVGFDTCSSTGLARLFII